MMSTFPVDSRCDEEDNFPDCVPCVVVSPTSRISAREGKTTEEKTTEENVYSEPDHEECSQKQKSSPPDSPPSKCQRIKKILKYLYVGTAFVAFTALMAAEKLLPAVDDAIDEQQEIWIDFVMESEYGTLFCLLFIAMVTICKSVGISDVLSLRTIAVAIFYWKLLPDHDGLSSLLCVLTLGLLSAISHLLEYKLIGPELQEVQGVPIKRALPLLRKLFLLCVREDRIQWLDFEWTFKLSEMTRTDPKLDIVTNLDRTLTELCCGRASGREGKDDDATQTQCKYTKCNVNTQSQCKDDASSQDESGCSIRRWSWQCLMYFLASMFAGCLEWIVPFADFFTFAHNWDFSFRNAVVVVLMEICDLDRIVETYMILEQLRCCNDPFGGKAFAVWLKPVYYVLGYVVVLPLTLMWYKKYYQMLTRDDEAEVDITIKIDVEESVTGDNSGDE